MNKSLPTCSATLADLVTSEVVETSLCRKLQSLLRAAAQGAFPQPVKLRGRYYWFKHDLADWIEQQRQGCREVAPIKAPPAPEADVSGNAVDVTIWPITTEGGDL